MAQNELDRARALIVEKRYAEARQLLKTINHPQARAWLLKLDEVAPAPPEPKNLKHNDFVNAEQSEIETEPTFSDLTNSSVSSSTNRQELKALDGIAGGIKVLTLINVLLFAATVFIGLIIFTRILPLQAASMAASSNTTEYETKIVDCDSITSESTSGKWHVVSSYSYNIGDAKFGYTVYTKCVLERLKPAS